MDERDERFPDTLGSPGHVEGVEGGNFSMSTFLGCYFLAPHGKRCVLRSALLLLYFT